MFEDRPAPAAPAPGARVARRDSPAGADRGPAARRTGSRLPVIALYSATLAVSAALVFLVQPMFARFVLPLLGGTPAVWTTAMLFFQTALLLAYLYAHSTTRRFGARRQAALHLALVTAALLVLPIGVPEGWTPPIAGSPVPWLLLLLLVAVGLPFFVVSSTAPLLQSWLAATDHPDAGDPYFLYRASNVGSVLGLLAYPALVEPGLTLDGQRWMWSAGYGLLALMLTACAAVLWRSRRPAGAPAGGAAPPADGSPATRGGAFRERLTAGRRLRWIALAFVPSSLMLGATTALTTNLAPVPLLWVLPLSLYLVSFIVVFSRGEGPGPGHRLALLALPPLAVLLAGVIAIGFEQPLWLIGLIHLVTFFVAALVCHGELAGDRPSAAQLTQFYAFVSLGGALGGVFNVVVAPLAFDSLTEYPIALVLACFLLPLRSGSWADELSVRRDLLPPLALGAAAAAALIATEGERIPHRLTYVAAGLLCLLLARHPLRFGLAVAAVMVAAWVPTLDDRRVIYQDRSFFGINRVESTHGEIVHELHSGTVLHGAQIGGRARQSLTYYHPTGPLGQLLDALPDRSVARRAGIVGLGAGSIACLSQSGDRWTFFEIDAAVERLARNNELFAFLRDCPGRFDVVLGDGRLSIGRQPDGRFGLIVLDAFSSDSIPTHLLTRDAVELYRRKLLPRGALAFHVTNRFLDLEPVLGNVARATGLACFAQDDRVITRRTWLKLPSHWVAMARTPGDLGRIARDRRWHPCRREPRARPWSDDYANVLGAMRWR